MAKSCGWLMRKGRFFWPTSIGLDCVLDLAIERVRPASLTLRALLPSKLPFPRTAQENRKGRGSGLLLEVNE
jgi:hypothetical protein